MPFQIPKKAVVHAAAFILALSIVLAGVLFLQRAPIAPPSEGVFTPNLGSGKTATENLIKLDSALRSESTVVVLGSSELTQTQLEYIPYHFLPRTLNIPVFAYGHANFQSFLMHGLLAANDSALNEKTRLVLILSPGWFKTTTVPLDNFVEHFQPQVLSRIYKNPPMRQLVKDYILLHRAEFSTSTRFQDSFIVDAKDPALQDEADRFMNRAAIDDTLYALKVKTAMGSAGRWRWMVGLKKPAQPHSLPLADWQQRSVQAHATEVSLMTDNTQWVRNAYFDKYIKGKDEAAAHYFPDTIPKQYELAAVSDLLGYLKSKNVRPLIVMQPINPYVYKDAAQAISISADVAKICASNGMPYFDMTAPKYVPGTLQDSMHFGELGWLDVDRKIVEYLNIK